MKSQELAVYREIEKSTVSAMTAMDAISDKIYDGRLAMQATRQSMKYTEIHNAALDQILKAGAEPYRPGYLSDFVLKSGIHCSTLLNNSTERIAELMIKRSNSGILEMNRALNHNSEAGERPSALARQLIEFEEKNIARLKKYL